MKLLHKRIAITAAILGTLATILGFFLGGPDAALALAAGSSLGAGNFVATREIGRKAIDIEAGKLHAPWVALFVVKFLVFGLLIYLGVAVAALAVIPFVIGISFVLIALFLESLRVTALRPSPTSDWS